MMENVKKSLVKELSLEFSLLLIEFEQKSGVRKSLLNQSQLIRSGTAVGAMIREAQGAESRKDFIHKMKIAFKEAEETEYWLILNSKENPSPDIDKLRSLINQILKMLSKIISTSIKNERMKNL